MGDLRHECGIAALYWLGGRSKRSLERPESQVTRLIPPVLLDMQNRGQLAAGIASYHPGRQRLIRTFKDVGSVAEVFRLSHPAKAESLMQQHAGPAAIGHVRYATCGADNPTLAQPFERQHGRLWKWFAFSFNGNLANYQHLRREILKRRDYHLVHDTDTEILLHSISRELRGDQPPDWVQVFTNLAQRFDGAYNIVLLNALGEMVVARDPLGIRPLCYARRGRLFGAASESVALANLGFSDIRSLEPGALILLRNGRMSIERFAPSPRRAHCFFEWIYFANVASTLDGRSVYLSRSNLGRWLARLETETIDTDCIVVPVPDTAKAAADAMAHALGIPSVEGLMRNRYLGRTFIEGASRDDKVRRKYTALAEVLRGRRVFLVEDTIVRSTTLRHLVKNIRACGTREIHVRVACPPIVGPCFYGIDMSTLQELFAPRFLGRRNGRLSIDVQQKMARDLDVDSLRYLPLASIADSIGLDEGDLCRACLTGHYPTPFGNRLYRKARRHSAQAAGKRTYE